MEIAAREFTTFKCQLIFPVVVVVTVARGKLEHFIFMLCNIIVERFVVFCFPMRKPDEPERNENYEVALVMKRFYKVESFLMREEN